MNFPDTNKIHKKPVPTMIESQAKLLEEYLSKVNWRVFGRAYLYVLAYVLLTVFALIVTVNVAKAISNLFI